MKHRGIRLRKRVLMTDGIWNLEIGEALPDLAEPPAQKNDLVYGSTPKLDRDTKMRMRRKQKDAMTRPR